MSRQQRDALITLLRSAPRTAEQDPTALRHEFAQVLTRPAPDGVVTRPAQLGGRPASVFEPATAGPRGQLLYLHGGGYVVGSPDTHAGLTGELAGRAGVRAVSLDYRLAPEHPFPAAVDDGLAAYRDLLAGGVAASDLVLAGDSAGAGLVLAVLIAARDAGLPQPAGAVLFSPWVDLTGGGESIHTKHGIDPIFTPDQVHDYADRYLAGQDPAQPLASPLFADLTGLPPLLIQVGSHELLLDDAARLARAAGAAEVEVTLEIGAQLPHVFQHHYGRLEEADAALDRAARFLADRLVH